VTGLFGVMAGWLFFTTLAGVIGCVTVRWLILPMAPQADASTVEWLTREAASSGRLLAAFLPPLMVFLLVRQMVEFRDPYAPLSEDLALLLGTPWGRSWFVGMSATFFALGGLSLAARGRRVGWWMASVGVLALAAYPGLTGHAGGVEGPLRLFSLGADTLHVLASGAWMGGLATVLMLDRRWRRRGPPGGTNSLLPALVPPFSRVAVVSVGLLILTGTFASWLNLPTPSALWAFGYGRLLLFKVTLVTVVLGFGAWNWRRLTPILSRPDGPPSLARTAALELGIGTLVLLITAILVRASPLGH
jgi:putative copper export protein